MADVRVGIVSWNTRDLLDRCLAALPAAFDGAGGLEGGGGLDGAGGLDVEVVVVDNASSDDSAEVAARHADVRVVRNVDNVGYARAMNQALADTDAPVLIALNPDTEPPPGSLARLVATLHATPPAGVVVPRLAHADGRLQHSVHRFPSVASAAAVCFAPPALRRGGFGRRWWLEGAAPHDCTTRIDWAIGAVHVIRAAALDGAPPYTTRWFMYVEDLELCWRLRQHGWETWLDAEVTVPHVGNAAGAQAWGGGRAARFWRASYDFHAAAHGATATRRWATVNTLGAALHLLLRLVGSLLGGPRGAGQRRQAAELARLLPVHARAVVTCDHAADAAEVRAAPTSPPPTSPSGRPVT